MGKANKILVSNRLPINIQKKSSGQLEYKRSSGGLIVALERFHREEKPMWVGHCGLFSTDPSFPEAEKYLLSKNFLPVKLSKKIYNPYYLGISNATLWPLLHSFWQSADFDNTDWEAYKSVNQEFCNTIIKSASFGAKIWIHDYHLLLLPSMLKSKRSDLKVGFFIHIPFPEADIFKLLPRREEVLTGILGAEIIGFHTATYVNNFMQSCRKILSLPTHSESESNIINYHERKITVLSLPLGADVARISELALLAPKTKTYKRLKDQLKGQHILLGIDRLDYTKGILERLKGYQKFLRNHPEFVGKTTLIQQCIPSRSAVPAYKDLKSKAERLVGEINGEFNKPGYIPICYMYRELPQETVVSLYKLADVLLVTSLRDGLNLVCKEYVIARGDDYGALILSEFAGASETMKETQLINPFDTDAIAAEIYKSAVMTPEEKQRRMAPLNKRLIETDNLSWANNFMAAWARSKTNYTESVKPRLSKIDDFKTSLDVSLE